MIPEFDSDYPNKVILNDIYYTLDNINSYIT